MTTTLAAMTGRAVTLALKAPVLVYRFAISPYLGPNCRFQPTCSAYALEALDRHGPVRGTALALRRLSRCHPISWLGGASGYDPVPDARPAVPPQLKRS
jgi:putative membrane protein insertion efficiency factor